MAKKVRKFWRKAPFVLFGILLMFTGVLYPRPTAAAPCTSSGSNVTIHIDCEFAAGTYHFTGTLTVASGVTVTAQGDTGNNVGVILVSDNFHILGTISADGQGYASGTGGGAGAGPGGGNGGGFAHGADHGGNGGGTGGGEYGSLFAPINLGSGAGDDTESGNNISVGGGAVKLMLYGSGEIRLGDGAIISADATDANADDDAGSAGGSVWLDAPSGTVVVGSTNTATVRADGGNARLGGSSGGGGGGGGRVAIYAGTCTNCGNITTTAYGGLNGTQSGARDEGGAGSVFLKLNGATNGDILYDNNNEDGEMVTLSTSSTQTFDNVTIRNGAEITIPDTFTMTLASSGILTGGGTTQPDLVIAGGATFDSSSSTFLIDDLDVIHRGDLKGVTNLVLQSSTYQPNVNTATFSTQSDNRVDDVTLVSGIFEVEDSGPFYVENYEARSGSTTRHEINIESDTEFHKLHISATSTIDIQSGANVNVDSYGHQGTAASTDGYGPGGGCGQSGFAGGAGYGAEGGHDCDPDGDPYGSITQPVNLGSSGGNDTEGGTSGDGGGAIRFSVNSGGTITIDGDVSADGGAPSAADHGGGSGGSIWIDAIGSTIAGSGTFSANGGNAVSNQGGGSGSGGRIAVYYATDNSTWTFNNAGGAGGSQSSSEIKEGGAGTIYIKADGATNGDLIIDDNDRANANNTRIEQNITFDNITIREGADLFIFDTYKLTLASGGAFTGGGTTQSRMAILSGGAFDSSSSTFFIDDIDILHRGDFDGSANLVFRNSAFDIHTSSTTFSNQANNRLEDLELLTGTTMTALQSGPIYLDELRMRTGSTLTHSTNTTTAENTLTVTATSTIEVDSGATIDVDSKGYTAENGPGAGFEDTTDGSGGGHGGKGGNENGGTNGGAAYDSVSNPTDLGSGGGDDGNDGSATGGTGGGLVRLTAGTIVEIDGTITADGAVANGSSTTEAGAGGGGGIYISAPTLSGSGSIGAVGGNSQASGNGSGGGGGRIAVYFDTDASSVSYFVFGGSNGSESGTQQDGGSGTLYVKDNQDTHATLTVSNNNRPDPAVTPQLTSSETYKNMTLNDGAKYEIGSSETLVIDTGGSVTGGGTQQSELQILSGGTFTPPDATETFTGFDIDQDGTINTVTNLTLNDVTFQNNGTFGAGLTDLTLQTGSNFRQQSTSQLFSGSTLTIENGGTFTQEHTSTINITTVTIQSGGTLTHCDNSTAKSCVVDISSTTFDLQNGGSINVDSLGFDGSNGTGAGADNTCGGGGGYGGAGGTGTCTAAGGSTYGSSTNPTDLGSGGGQDTNEGPTDGFAGGGAIKLAVSTTLTVNGTITADGGGASGGSTEQGGGAGGSINLNTTNGTWAGTTGTIGANGGTGRGDDTNGGGCGGGGRVYIAYQVKTYSGSAATAAAGTGCGGGRVGAAGTVVEDQNSASIDTNSHSPTNPEVGDNVNFFCEASKASGGVSKIEIKQDNTVKKTCNFVPVQTPANCDVSVGSLAAGSYDNVCVATDNSSVVSSATDTFTVIARTTNNAVELSTIKKSETNVEATIMMTFAAASSGTLTVTWPAGFTVTSAATDAASDDCFSSFGFTSSTMTATKTNCTGTVQFGGGRVNNPSTAGQYHITWTNDDGGATVTIIDEDEFNITAAVDPSISFFMGSQAAASTCDGTFTGNGGTVALGALTTGAVASSDVSSVNHICIRGSTNGTGGAAITVLSANAALQSTSTPADTIPSSTATLTAGTVGYGLCVGSGGSDTGIDTTTPAGASVTRNSPFDGTCTTSGHAVGGVTASPQNLWTVSGPVQNAFGRVYVKAAIDGGTIAHDDYTDTLTFIMTATY